MKPFDLVPGRLYRLVSPTILNFEPGIFLPVDKQVVMPGNDIVLFVQQASKIEVLQHQNPQDNIYYAFFQVVWRDRVGYVAVEVLDLAPDICRWFSELSDDSTKSFVFETKLDRQ